MRCHAVILAGGEGRRMGGADKALLMLGGHPLVEVLARRLQPQVPELAISANGDPDRFRAILPGMAILPDLPLTERLGPLAGVLAGLEWAAALGARVLVTVPVDSPFVPADLVERLVRVAGEGPAYVQAGRDHYATALWPVRLAPDLRRFLQSGAKPRIADFAGRHGAVPVAFPDPAAFDNLNRPEDLLAAQTRPGDLL